MRPKSNITEASLTCFAQMTELNLRGNCLTEDMCKAVAACLFNIRRLYVHDCKITARGATIIGHAIDNRLSSVGC